MSGPNEEEINFNFPRPRKYNKLADLFKNDINNSADNNYNGVEMQDNNRYEEEEDDRMSNIPTEIFQHSNARKPKYNDREIESANHRTTSIHRNFDRKQDTALRTIPKNLEDRRKWVTHAATINRQPLYEHAQKILEYMHQDNVLMTNDPDGEILRKEALRNMPQCLAVKKIIKRKLMNSVNYGTNTLSCDKMFKYQISIWFSHVKSSLRNLSYSFELWYSSLKEIEGNFGSGVSTYFRFLRKLFLLNVLMTIFCISFIVIPQAVFNIKGKGSNVTIVENEALFGIGDIFTGSGYFSNTLMYYGTYTTGFIGDVYSMPDAYFYTLLSIFICNTVILGVSMAKLYRKNFIETMDGLQNVFAHKIFCGWDYGIAKNEAANLRSSTIYTELRELLSDYMKSKQQISWTETFQILCLKITGHVFILGLVGATGYVMWILLESHRNKIDDYHANTVAIFTAVIINLVLTVFPILFRVVTSYEGYKSPRIIIFVTFLRTLLLEMVVIGILVVFWLSHSQNQSCWENALGQEIYRLIIFDFFFSVILIALIDVARYYVHKKWRRNGVVRAPEFDIAGNTFSVIYNQTLFWLGIYFAPILSVIVVIKLFLTWYVKKWILLGYSVPPKKYWRAAQTETLFLIITFLSSLLLLFVHGYVMLNIPTSSECGPFKYMEYTHSIFLELLEKMEMSNNFLVFLNFIRKPGVVALILIAISMFVYYLRSKSIAQRDFVAFLRRRLVLAAQDKEFLLKHIMHVSTGDWPNHAFDMRHDMIDPTKSPPNIPTAISPTLNEDNDVVATSGLERNM